MNTRRYSKKQESGVAKRIGGKVQANSGATTFRKGDVTTKNFLVECKTATTEKVSMSIKKDWIDKLKEEAFAMHKPHWTLAFNFGGLGNTENFYIINEALFLRLQELIEEDE